MERQSEDPTIKMFGIWAVDVAKRLHRGVGVCGLTSIDRVNQCAEFSLYIAPSEQKHGFGTDALKTLLRHSFRDQNLNRIYGQTYDKNPALDMFKKIGMKYEGLDREAYFRNGKFIDCHRVSMLRSEFNVA